MIDVRELRIGNYLFMRENIVAIGGIPNRMCLLIPGQEYAVDLEQFEPITLTEELLLKCGFEKHTWGIVTYYSPLFELDADFHLKGVDYNIQVKSLHQLQNLYFDLGGQELEVNL